MSRDSSSSAILLSQNPIEDGVRAISDRLRLQPYGSADSGTQRLIRLERMLLEHAESSLRSEPDSGIRVRVSGITVPALAGVLFTVAAILAVLLLGGAGAHLLPLAALPLATLIVPAARCCRIRGTHLVGICVVGVLFAFLIALAGMVRQPLFDLAFLALIAIGATLICAPRLGTRLQLSLRTRFDGQLDVQAQLQVIRLIGLITVATGLAGLSSLAGLA